MGGKNKPAKPSAPAADSSKPAASSASKKRSKKGGASGASAQHALSALALALAVGATWYLSRPPPAAAPPGADSPICATWANDGECENNPSLMAQQCPVTCGARLREKKRDPKKKKKETREEAPVVAAEPAYTGPPDRSEHCGVWAAAGECEANAAYMQAECAHSCSGGSGGGGGGASKSKSKDLHQDCEPWVKDGECYRNPAFMLQQCKASCEQFAENNDGILQDTSDTCVNFALRGGCDRDHEMASKTCRASCHIQRICANHTEGVLCSKALRCEAIMDKHADCAARAARGDCESEPTSMLKGCLKSCSELDLPGLMRFHMPHTRTTLSPRIDLPGTPPRLAGFYSTPPNARATELEARALCGAHSHSHSQRGGPAGFGARVAAARERRRRLAPWGRAHWHEWDLRPGRERTPRVPHRFDRVPAEEGSERMVTVQHISYSPRVRYLHQLLSPEECEHIIRVATPRFSRSPVRGSVTRVRTSSTAMLGGTGDAVVSAVRRRIARFSGYAENLLEPLQVVKYQQGQKYEGHHDFFDVCDVEDKRYNGRRQVTFLIYLKGMPPGESGGGTAFPELKLEVAPEQGSAVVFNDCLDNGDEDQRSLHAGLPPANPDTVKYAINGWIRSARITSMGAM